ncbi:hypothetical protein H1P_1340001 [Hyella patelloides LEGE 07179]|uniref:Uncharacterized protein n=3 Tax=Hyella TaxID=945733 RepID=A0A563VL03_9CYAN|nr:hypothetical protein H1P_1340001 [Hyella patelloides LEGE 07179]
MNQELLYFPGSENILSVPPNMLLLVVRLKRVAHWDRSHKVNLAFEAWRDGELQIYLSQMVNPEDFSNLEKKQHSQNIVGKFNSSSKLEAIVAFLMILWGVWLLIF